MENNEPIQILLVDDDIELCSMLKLHLEGTLFAIADTAANITDAREKLASSRFDIIAIDYLLPDGSGFDLVEEVTAMSDPPEVLMVTAHGDENTAVQAFRTGVSGYVVKDNRLPTMLVEEIKDALAKSALKKVEQTLREREARYRLILNNISDLIWIRDLNMRPTFISPSFVRTTGFTLEELQSTPLEKRLTPESYEELMNAFSTEFTKEKLARKDLEIRVTIELEYYRKDSSTFWAETEVSLLRDNEGTPRGFLGVSHDVTERRRAEQAIRESDERYRLHFQQTTDVIVTFDDNLRLLDVSPSVEKLIGYTPEELVGRPFPELRLMTEESLKRALADFTRALHGQTLFGLEYEFITKNGTTRFGEASAVPLFKDRKVVSVVSVFRDITERKLAENALRESEERYSQMFDNMSSGVAVFEAMRGGDFIIKDVNKAAARIEGLDRDDIIGRPVQGVFPGIKEFGLLDVLWSVYQTGIPEHHPASYYSDDRTAGWRENYVYRLPSGEVVAIYDDVNEKIQAETSLRESEEAHRFLIESLQEGVWAIDKNMVTAFVNTRMAEMLGRAPEEVPGESILNYIDEKDVPFFREKMERIREGSKEQFDLELLRTDGTRFHASIEPSAILDDNGSYAGALAAVADITDRWLAEKTVERNAAELSDLIDVAAHELRHPATVFKGYANILLEHWGKLDEETVIDALRAIDRATDRLTHIVIELLDTSKIERDEFSLALDEVFPSAPVVRAVDEIRVRGYENELNVELPEDEKKARFDPDKINSVLGFLLENAVLFSPEGSEIDILCEDRAGEIVYQVADRGPGISPEDREKVFERFFQVEEAAHHSTPGIGLGLYIARTIVEAHGGWITVEPREGGGSVFSFGIPRNPEFGDRTPAVEGGE